MTTKKIRVALVVPHLFIHRDILPNVIFSPGRLALDLCDQLSSHGVDVTLFSPGPASTNVQNITADLSYFEAELAGRGDTYLELLKKHPFTFISLARQVQSELVAKAYKMANDELFDIVHIYTNEEDTALPFASLCQRPVIFTHHDPFNFLVKYKNVFPKYKHLPWISMSMAQRDGMPKDTNWVDTIYHGLEQNLLVPIRKPSRDYIAFLGRIIEPKGVHIAIQAILEYNRRHTTPLTLKIAGKHYSGHSKDQYWQTHVQPHLGDAIEYVGYLKDPKEKNTFLGNARALLVPSTFDEPFGMVTIEALACDTPVIGLDVGATKEIIEEGKTGFIVPRQADDRAVDGVAAALEKLDSIQPGDCRAAFEQRFTLERMAAEHAAVYQKLT